jgi:hypothetical protein
MLAYSVRSLKERLPLAAGLVLAGACTGLLYYGLVALMG